MVLGFLLDLLDLPANVGKMVAVGSLPFQSGQSERRAPKRWPHFQAGFHLLFSFVETTIELQLQAAEVAKIRVVVAQSLGSIHKRKRLSMFTEELMHMGKTHEVFNGRCF